MTHFIDEQLVTHGVEPTGRTPAIDPSPAMESSG
jgi:hypothetical protein